jgi:hypothetical protein
VFLLLSWVAWLVFADRHLRRGENVKSITEVAKAFWRWRLWSRHE